MAKRSVTHAACTLVATADTTNLADSSYPFVLQGGSTTQISNILKLRLEGQAAASVPVTMITGFDSQVGTGTNTRDSTQNDAPLSAASAALAAPVLTGNKFATNKPQRSSSLHVFTHSFNAFGGQAAWNAVDANEQIMVVGNAANLGELSCSSTVGVGPISAYCEYETL